MSIRDQNQKTMLLGVGEITESLNTSILEPDLHSSRTTVNQTTFAILISILVVADMFLVWSLGYILIYYEKKGILALNHYFAVKFNKRRLSDVSRLEH